MAIHRIPQITKEDVAGVYKKAVDAKEKDPQTAMKLINMEFHLLVADKMELSAEKRDQLIILDSHRQRLSLALASKLISIPHPSVPTLTRPLAEGILKKHRELALAESTAKTYEADRLMARIERDEDPAGVLDESFLFRALSVCSMFTKRVLGQDGFIVYNELHSQISRITSSDKNILEFAKSLSQGRD